MPSSHASLIPGQIAFPQPGGWRSGAEGALGVRGAPGLARVRPLAPGLRHVTANERQPGALGYVWGKATGVRSTDLHTVF